MTTHHHKIQYARLLKTAGLCILACCVIAAMPRPGRAEEQARVVESFMLPAPRGLDDKKYLGIPAAERFDIADIDASLLVIEFFSLYCSQCHKEADGVNELFGLIAQNPKLRAKVKMIGIGTGNTSDEVETFRQQHQVPFPVFADTTAAAMKSCGVRFTPTFICVQKGRGRPLQIVHAASGRLGAPSAFADVIAKLAGL